MRWVDTLQQAIDHAKEQERTASGSTYAPSVTGTVDARRPSEPLLQKMDGPSPIGSAGDSIIGDDETFGGDEDDAVPHADDFHLLAQSNKTQIELAQQLLASLHVSTSSADASATISSTSSSSAKEVQEALKKSLSTLESMLDDYADVVQVRERYFVKRYEKEVEAKRMWEDSMRDVAAQHAALEVELQKASRDNTRRKRALQEVRANFGAASPGLSGMSMQDVAASYAAERDSSQSATPKNAHLPEDGSQPLPSPLASPSLAANRGRADSRTPTISLSPVRTRTRAGTTATSLGPAELEQLVDSALHNEDGGSSDEEDDDEFFEAIETGAIPLEEEPTDESGAAVERRTEPAKRFIDTFDPTPYKGYENGFRSSLPISNDNRPSVSLWAILKGSIGKDL